MEGNRIEKSTDLLRGVTLTRMDRLFAEGDKEAHKFVVGVTLGKAAVTLDSGATVTGHFIRADDNTLPPISGSVVDGKAVLTLPEAAYRVPGYFSLIIKATVGEMRCAIFWGDGEIVRSETDTIVDPDHTIPSLEDLLAQIATMETATKAANTATANANTATSKANTATTNANNATTNANNAASAANTAAAAANAAAKNWEDSTAADSEKLGGKAPEYYLQPRNLLDNSDFTNPVNQRGVVNGDYSWAYALDRWLFNGTGFEVGDGVSIPSGGKIVQRIPENTLSSSGGVTLAIGLSDGTVIVDGINDSSGIALSVAKNSSGLVEATVYNTSSSAVTVIWAALYEGSYTADTLPPYVPKGYSAELAECQRFFRRINVRNGYMYVMAYNATSARMYLPFGMRIEKPTVQFDSAINLLKPGTSETATITSVAGEGANESMVFMNISSSSLTAGAFYILYPGDGIPHIDISADL